ncbi:VirB4-like conjugal transfer ATPase, CD1110 family [Butyrivibrio sp. M55]|uniref:VirB4-like conjugal transfer ATPase, CD1110 family n=1 Tax=Butyrivibrio sp. M55 TaxID=1855323 RepID=UPI0008E8510F|nr:PrgI family protein [Butyrivibrio sp. M55]SFU89445.1 Type IV secretory pathway, VirB4 component [Butyrivibrio sp. M55]
MIAVRIPEEIRKYKEKLAFGLTARQLICTILTCAICVPLYWKGKDVIPEDILGWAIMFIALPLLSVGFIRFNGVPMERMAKIFFLTQVLYPIKRKYKSENAFRTWQDMADAEDRPKSSRDRKKFKKYKEELALEKTFLLAEAEANGEATYTSDVDKEAAPYDVDKEKILTVRNPLNNKNNKKNKDENNKKKTETKLAKKAKAIEQKQIDNPEYVPNKREFEILKKYKSEQLKLRKQEIERGKKQLRKKNSVLKKRRHATTIIPKTVQQSIPFIADYDEGLFEVEPNKFSKMYAIKDINYKTAQQDEQVDIFVKLGEFFNHFSDEMKFQICIDNRTMSKKEQQRRVFKQMKNDGNDRHRVEYNKVIARAMSIGKNDMNLQKYITVTIDADSPIEALLRFHKIDAEVVQNLKKIGSDGRVLSTTERLSFFHDKFRRGREGEFHIDYDYIKKQGISSKDYIAPEYMEFRTKHIQVEDEYYRVLYLNNLPKSLQDEFFALLVDQDFPITTTLSIQPVAQDKGLRIVKKQLTGIEANKIDAEKRAIKSGYSPETIPHSIKDAHVQAEELYDDMLNKNQKMFFVTITCLVHGKSLEELDDNCNHVMSIARQYTCQLQCLTIQQEEAWRVTLPFGYHPHDMCVDRALTTEASSIFMPFRNQELFHSGGFYYGRNSISQNLVIVNRTEMKTPSGFILGSSGSGKSFAVKREMLNVFLDDDKTGILVIDPENEYSAICKCFGGTVIKISADSDFYINPMDMNENYGLDEDDDVELTPLSTKKEKALKKKSDYILSIIERMISMGGSDSASMITPSQKTIVDRCVRKAYAEYLDHDFDPEYLPTLLTLQDALDEEGELSVDAHYVAEGVEYFTRGSMDVFSHKTNVDVNNRFVVFNVRDLGEQLRQIALIIVFDFIWNRMVENKNKGIRTYCYCDEIHVMFRSYYSADYLKQLYKRGRKYGLVITGITQDIEDLLQSEQARGMLSNSDFIMMLNQKSENLRVLAGMLNISESQMGYVTNADSGNGLLFAESTLVPFEDKFPEDSYLYKLLSTKFGEGEESDREMAEYVEKLISESNFTEQKTDKEIEKELKDKYGIQAS